VRPRPAPRYDAAAMADEWVVLVDDDDREIGTARKRDVHHAETPLHRAFSLFLFDAGGRTLLQRRATSKRTWPGIWSNACCGHPAPGESRREAVVRRARQELGVAPLELFAALPDYRYRAELDGVVENEICPVWVGALEGPTVELDPDEVAEVRWLDWSEFLATIAADPEGWSPWSLEEAKRLDADAGFRAWFERLTAAPRSAGAAS